MARYRRLNTLNGTAGAPPIFVRLVASERDTHSKPARGVFQAAYRLLRVDVLAGELRLRVREELDWFNDHLPRPERFVRTRSKGFYRREAVAISWFRAEAADHLAHAETLARHLVGHGLQVNRLQTTHPGYVVYEDAYQVVTIPFRDRLVERAPIHSS